MRRDVCICWVILYTCATLPVEFAYDAQNVDATGICLNKNVYKPKVLSES